MLKITTEYGVLVVSKETSIPLTITNPMFNERGSGSLPFSIPDCEHNQKTLNYPNRITRSGQQSLSISATIETEIKTFTGTLKFINASEGKIELAFYTQEGAFWEWAKKIKLTELDFPSSDPYSGTIADKLDSWKARLINSNSEVWPDEYFNIFPVIVESITADVDIPEFIWGTGISNWRILNAVDPLTGDLVFTSLGYAWKDVSPFLYFNALIQLIANNYGYKIENELETLPAFNRACIVNNATTPIINGILDWKQLVSDITVLDFIDIMESKMGLIFYTDTKTKTLKAKLTNTTVTAQPTINLPCNINIRASEPLQINLGSDMSVGHYGDVVQHTDEFLQDLPIDYDDDHYSIMDNEIIGNSTTRPNGSLYQKICHVKSMESFFYLRWLYNKEETEYPWENTYKFIGNRLRKYEPETDNSIKSFDSKSVILPMAPAYLFFYQNNILCRTGYLLPDFPVPLKDNITDEFSFSAYNAEVSFPFNICIYRGKYYNTSNLGLEHFFPWGSSFTYTFEGYPLNNKPSNQVSLYPDEVTLINVGRLNHNTGIYDLFWKNVEQWYLQSAKEIDIYNLKLSDVLDNDIFSIFQNQDNVNFLFKEIKLTLNPLETKFDSAIGLTVKPYL